ncbi:MAG TPA: alkaline phosphatase family protein [Acidobacteriaceae bacterium]|nr:alkaline phosphatase family protein [Acidobacteriaceae bacterium]
MKPRGFLLAALLAFTPSVFATVTVTSPANGSTVTSPVHYVATASAGTCAQGVSAMGIYVNNSLVYQTNGNSLDTTISLNPGTYYTVVQEWDNCGGATTAPINITVGGSGGGSGSSQVTVTSPANNSTVTSPVTYTATATSTCAAGVASMGIYVNNNLEYVVDGNSLNTQLTLNPGTYYTVVQEWDNCGGAATTPINITVSGSGGGGGGNGYGSQTAVNVSTPAPNATVTSPVTYQATATTSTCTAGVSAMGIYVNNNLVYTVNGDSLNTQISLPTGQQYTVVEEWDQCGGAATTAIPLNVVSSLQPTVSMTANPASITAGQSSTLTVNATNASSVTVTGGGNSWTLSSSGGTVSVSPSVTTTYTAQASSSQGTATADATVTVVSSTGLSAVQHVIFMLQENHSFDNYFGMLNPYRQANGWNIGQDGKTYNIDGIDDKLSTFSNQTDEGTTYYPFKLASTCVDDMTSAWLESYGDVSRWDFSTSRPINMDGFVHVAENFDKTCAASGACSGSFTDSTGHRAMGYYDQGFLNYYYYMASQFAVSDRWFSPVSSKSVDNRIATFSGGTTQGLTHDPGSDDHLPQLQIQTIFDELQSAGVSWKIYYTVTQGLCTSESNCSGDKLPATDFTTFASSNKYLYENPSHAACTGSTQPSSVVGDSTNSFCIDPNHIAPLSQYYTDAKNNTLPAFAFIEAGYGNNDEHPGSGQSILSGQVQVSNIVNALMSSPSWGSSVFFFSYDEGGGPLDHVPPVPGHSNQNTDASLGSIPDISSIAVNPDSYKPCLPPNGTPTTHCDLDSADPGVKSTDAPAVNGFAAQLGFRVPNVVISPFTRRHYVSHIPMDHTAIIKFVENRFLGSSAHLTAHDAAQPNLLDFFDFTSVPWATPPSPPAPVTPQSLGYDPCQPNNMGG